MARATAFALLFTLALSVSPLWAQEPVAEPGLEAPGLQQEVARLNVIMKEIAGLLQRQIDSQETDLLIRRGELANRGLGPAKERLRQAQDDLISHEDEETNLVRTLEMFSEEISGEQGPGDPEAKRRMAMQLEQLEDRLEVVQARKRALKREITELESDVLSREQDMRLLEDLIDARLGLK